MQKVHSLNLVDRYDSVTQSEIKSSSSLWVQQLCLWPVRELRDHHGYHGVQEEEEEAAVTVVVAGWVGVWMWYIAFDLC